MRLCSTEGCGSKHYAKNFCRRCYKKAANTPEQAKRANESRRGRYETDPTYAQRCKDRVNTRRASNPDVAEAHRQREAARRTPEFAAKQRPYFREYARRYRANHPEYASRHRAAHRAWTKKNLSKCKAYAHMRRSRAHNAGGSYTTAEWETVLGEFGNRCASCRMSGPLQADHIIPVSWGGPSWIWNIQPLCKSCNCRKHATMIVAYSPKGEP